MCCLNAHDHGIIIVFKTDTWSYFDLDDSSKVMYGNATLSTKNIFKRLDRDIEVKDIMKRPTDRITKSL